jgi:hypothetical protein
VYLRNLRHRIAQERMARNHQVSGAKHSQHLNWDQAGCDNDTGLHLLGIGNIYHPDFLESHKHEGLHRRAGKRADLVRDLSKHEEGWNWCGNQVAGGEGAFGLLDVHGQLIRQEGGPRLRDDYVARERRPWEWTDPGGCIVGHDRLRQDTVRSYRWVHLTILVHDCSEHLEGWRVDICTCNGSVDGDWNRVPGSPTAIAGWS